MDKKLEDHFLDTLSLCQTVAKRNKRQCIFHVSMDDGEAVMAFAGTNDDIIDSVITMMFKSAEMRDIILVSASEYMEEAGVLFNQN